MKGSVRRSLAKDVEGISVEVCVHVDVKSESNLKKMIVTQDVF